MGKDYLETAMDLILSENSRVETIYFLMSEDNVRMQLRQPWMKFGTDAGGPDPGSVRGIHDRRVGERQELVLQRRPQVPRQIVGGVTNRLLVLSLSDIRARPRVSLAVTMECAGNGRARLAPMPASQPWLAEAVGTAEWTGTRLRPLLEDAGVGGDAVEIVFTGADRGIEDGLDLHYQRSLPLSEAILSRDPNHMAALGVSLHLRHAMPEVLAKFGSRI